MSAPELLPWWPRDADECSRRLSIDTGAKVRAMVARLAELEARTAPSPAASEDAEAAFEAWYAELEVRSEEFARFFAGCETPAEKDLRRISLSYAFAAGRTSTRTGHNVKS